jgi:hypothetical protein
MKEILNYKNNKIVQGIRQSGKTTLALAEALYESINGNTVVFVCMNASQIPYLKSMTIRLNKVIFLNSSNKNFIDKIRGLKYDKIIFDEISLSNYQKELIDFISLNINVCPISIYSTRNDRSKKNAFWKFWIESEKNNLFKRFTISYKQCPHLTKEKRKELKLMLGRTTYEKDYTIRNK